MKQVPLIAWAQSQFDPPPSLHTLRRWCREDRIFPKPVLVGRDYRVQADAVYVPPARPIRLGKVNVIESKDSIVNAIIRGTPSNSRP